MSRLLIGTLIAVTIQFSPISAEGGTWQTHQGAVDIFNEKWGYYVSYGWPGDYVPNQANWFNFNLPNNNYEGVSFYVLKWQIDRGSLTGDRLTMQVLQYGSWVQLTDFYYYSDMTWLNNYRNWGSVRFYWVSDGFNANSPRNFQITFTYQKFVFGCELNPQPYIFTNSSLNGVIKSPYFPDHYPVNSYCQTIIDVDNGLDTIEFTPIMFELRAGDSLIFYVGDVWEDTWVLYATFTNTYSTSNLMPTFRIYGNDVKILFVSDYVACSNGYLFYWRIFKKEKYGIYQRDSLAGFWPLTAAHRGNDIINGCNAVTYPSDGSVAPAQGPFGDSGTGLAFSEAYLNMTTSVCKTTTLLTGGVTLSMFIRASSTSAIVEWASRDASNYNLTYGWGSVFFANWPTAGNIFLCPQTSPPSSPAANLTTSIQTKWQFVSGVYDPSHLRQFVSLDGLKTASAISTLTSTPATRYGGFFIGQRDPKWGAQNPLVGKLSCLSMYSKALSYYDIAQVRSMCQKFSAQYTIYKPLGAPLIWCPLNSASGLKDISGNGFHAVAPSGHTLTTTTGPNGSTDGAYNFDTNANSYMQFPYDSLKLAYGAFTISLFMQTSQSGIHDIVNFFYNGVRGVGLALWPDQNSLTFDPNCAVPNNYITAGSQNFATWKFVSATYDPSTTTIALWVDAVRVQQKTNLPTGFRMGVGAGGFYLGVLWSSPAVYKYIGQMACFSIYRMAMNAAQLSQLRQACLTNPNLPPGQLLGFWPLTGLTGLLDISGNEIHGVAQSTSVVPAPGPFGVPNTAYSLSGDVDSYINFTSPSLDLGQSSYTISIFVKHTATGRTPLVEFTTDFGIHVGASIWVDWPSTNGFSFNPMFPTNPYIYSPNAFANGKWQFVTASYDALAGKIYLYRDGAQVAVGNVAANTSSGNFLNNFNIGRRVGDIVNIFKGQVACLSIYRAALSADEIGQVKSMCHSYLLDSALQDQTAVAEVNCNFDSGFCGWTQDTSDDGADWRLGHDWTTIGQRQLYYTGPRMGVSAERADALDQYALLNSATLGVNLKASLLSPIIGSGWHCFEFWYYMGGKDVNALKITLRSTNIIVWSLTGEQPHQWNFVAIPFYVASDSWEQISIDGWTGLNSWYSDIAVDNVRLTEGRCLSATPCPRGWIDYGRKCYINFAGYLFSRADAIKLCSSTLKARLALPEDSGEVTFLTSFGPSMHVDATIVNSVWSSSFNLALSYLPTWRSAPTGGTKTAMGLSATGTFDYVPDTNIANKYGFLCEVTKLEAMHLGFNCTFDNKHLCGWWNDIVGDQRDGTSQSSLDIDVNSGIALPWYNEQMENGPEWDWNKGNLRGYYLLMQDKTFWSGNYLDFYSPLMKGTGQWQCFTMRVYHHGQQMNNYQVYLYEYVSGNRPYILSNSGGNWGQLWRTFRAEIRETVDYMIQVRVFGTGNQWGNQIFDDVSIVNGTCGGMPAFFQQTSNGNLNAGTRVWGAWFDDSDTLNDWTFRSFDWSTPYRQYTYGDNADWSAQTWTREPGFRRSGPMQDYDGEGWYLNLDTTAVGSFGGVARFTGPPIPSGARCFIFHYFQHGIDVGELRMVDASTGRVIWSGQRPQSPAWREHRILFTDVRPTSFNFEGTSGFLDKAEHWQKYQTLQLDAFWLRNGTDLCLGYMDCNFDGSAYLSTCGWYQNDTDELDWIRNSGETPTGNALTGPASDHTTGIGHYLYVETTNVHPGATARLHMPATQTGMYCLTFYFHMWGADMGSLRVFYVPQSSLLNSSGNYLAYTETTLWQKSGNQGNTWIRAMVPLEAAYPQVLTFEATVGNGQRSDIAIDDVVLLKGSCPFDRGYSCSFERGDLCSWSHDPTAPQKFVIGRGKTKGAPITGPEGDATGAYAGGFYAYLPASTSNAGDTAKITSPWFQPGTTICFQMAYNMRGRQLGQLAVYRNSQLLTRMRSGSTDLDWRRLRLEISLQNSYTVSIEAKRGPGALGDIAIDDIKITEGPCGSPVNATNQTSIYQYRSKSAYSLTMHEMLPAPVKVANSAFCVNFCQQTAGCMSVNFDSSTSLCQLNNATADLDPYNLKSAAGTMTNIWVVSPSKQADMRMQNLCTLDSTTCTPTSTCTTSPLSYLMACRCVATGYSCFMPQDCQALYDAGYMSSGDYIIQPSMTGSFVPTWCDMDVQLQRGYTVLLSRSNGGVRFHGRTLREYSSFFGSPDGEFWIGLDAMSQLTTSRNYGYLIEASYNGQSFTPISGSTTAFKIGDITTNYTLQSATSTSVMFAAGIVGKGFSAIDQDVDTSTDSCAIKQGQGGWWYASCADGILTGPYRPGENLATTKDGFFSTEFNSGIGLSGTRLKIWRI